jgi:hypothetical protein
MGRRGGEITISWIIFLPSTEDLPSYCYFLLRLLVSLNSCLVLLQFLFCSIIHESFIVVSALPNPQMRSVCFAADKFLSC